MHRILTYPATLQPIECRHALVDLAFPFLAVHALRVEALPHEGGNSLPVGIGILVLSLRPQVLCLLASLWKETGVVLMLLDQPVYKGVAVLRG